jgi:HK97 family phage prohead protease
LPYQSNDSLPGSVRDKYSTKCQSVFRQVFNSTYKESGEERAFQNAHAAARRCQERKSMPEATKKFTIYSGLLKAYEDPDGKKRLKTVASSTIKDRAGDQITERAIRKMAETAKENMTIFLNHSYKVPEDVFGSVEEAVVVQREAGVWDLDFDVRLNTANERAVKTYEAIANGTKLGTSIGAGIVEGGVERDKDSGGWIFNDVELYEASIVALPANPRSWVQYALKSWIDSEDIESDPEDEPPIQKTVWVETASGDKVTVGDPVETQEDKAEKQGDEPDIEKSQETEDPETPEPAAAEAETGEEEAQETVVADTEPEVTKSAEDTPPSAQEGQETTPESADIVQEADAVKVADFASLIELLRSTTNELVEVRNELAEEQSARLRAEEEAKKLRGELLEAKEIVEIIQSLPQGRRAVVQYHATDFRTKFGHLYSDDFVKLMEKKDA